MSKAYLFAVMLLVASLTGCIESGDELEKSTSPNEEEDILEPVGTNGNETVSYDELIAEIANLTEQIEELNNQIAVLSDDLQSLDYYRSIKEFTNRERAPFTNTTLKTIDRPHRVHLYRNISGDFGGTIFRAELARSNR